VDNVSDSPAVVEVSVTPVEVSSSEVADVVPVESVVPEAVAPEELALLRQTSRVFAGKLRRGSGHDPTGA
jgi:hypothetical protein